ncbi:penicillin-insensitive murein endopeptidase [Thaumasiovibrio subtropicus]|uniref:penicillin-insensitive murein endopeptidase n=1 Tax=Thaumasiovibrio subtropicus TaxID=1891207 RepID=UPI000B3580AE|nr:penicillin-insensitive murein endopeptidase [Thaumasiovibrio subtropicus]
MGNKLVSLGCLMFALGASNVAAVESTCYGTTSNGRLENGVNLPSSGDNFVTYSHVARMAGRTYVHSEVKAIVLDAYKALAVSHPDKVFKYAETGYEEGGRFRPHKTHRNGLSVDFMTPMINSDGESEHLPTHPFNKFGYNVELDANGRLDDLHIDYDAMAAHIVALHKASTARGHDLWRVIFDPKLQAGLFETEYGSYLKRHIQFSKKRSWVRHDEHYHIDFSVPCQ